MSKLFNKNGNKVYYEDSNEINVIGDNNMFSKRHYGFIAKQLNDRYKIAKKRNHDLTEIENLIYQFATELKLDNKRFNWEKFINTCFDN